MNEAERQELRGLVEAMHGALQGLVRWMYTLKPVLRNELLQMTGPQMETLREARNRLATLLGEPPRPRDSAARRCGSRLTVRGSWSVFGCVAGVRMDAVEALMAFAEFERRALELYRCFAALYAGTPELAALWREMSDIEAAHFATLSLAADMVQMEGGGAAVPPSLTPGSLDATRAILQNADQKAADGTLPAGEAVQLALLLESSELPRIMDILAWLPGRAKASVGSGIAAGLEGHLQCLERLAHASGRADVAEKSRALQALARGITRRTP